MKNNIVKINESILKRIVAESVKKVLAENYLEPGTVDYEYDRISKLLKNFFPQPQYEDFIYEYVYGGYYKPYTRMSRYINSPDIGIKNGFIEFVKKMQGR